MLPLQRQQQIGELYYGPLVHGNVNVPPRKKVVTQVGGGNANTTLVSLFVEPLVVGRPLPLVASKTNVANCNSEF